MWRGADGIAAAFPLYWACSKTLLVFLQVAAKAVQNERHFAVF
jgi:hypothetical protein